MNKETWIAVAQIAIPSIIAVFIGIWQVRVMRAMANPAQSQPKLIRSVAGKIKYLIKKYGPLVVVYGLLILILFRELTRPEPLDRWSVFFTALSFSMLTLFVALQIVIYILRTLINVWRTAEAEFAAKELSALSDSPNPKE